MNQCLSLGDIILFSLDYMGSFTGLLKAIIGGPLSLMRFSYTIMWAAGGFCTLIFILTFELWRQKYVDPVGFSGT